MPIHHFHRRFPLQLPDELTLLKGERTLRRVLPASARQGNPPPEGLSLRCRTSKFLTIHWSDTKVFVEARLLTKS